MIKNMEYYMSLPYRMEVIPDTEEGGYIVRFPDLPGCLTSADTVEKAFTNALDAKKAWLTAALEEGISIAEPSAEDDLEGYSGQFKLRMPKSLHRSLQLHARQEGISMNQYCLYLLTKNDTAHIRQTSPVS